MEPSRGARTILVVENSPELLEAYIGALELAGYPVVGVDSVDTALYMLRQRHFDAVLTDYMLGDGTGLDLLERAHHENLLVGTPALMCTAHRNVTAPSEVRVLQKPIGSDDLMAAMEGLFAST